MSLQETLHDAPPMGCRYSHFRERRVERLSFFGCGFAALRLLRFCAIRVAQTQHIVNMCINLHFNRSTNRPARSVVKDFSFFSPCALAPLETRFFETLFRSHQARNVERRGASLSREFELTSVACAPGLPHGFPSQRVYSGLCL